MSDPANMFKKLTEGRLKSTPAKTEEESKPASKSNPPEKAKKTPPKPSPEEKLPEVAIGFASAKRIAPEEANKKRGRPATGKRSDPDWIGRTY